MKTSAPARAASPLASTSLPTASKVRRFHAQGGTRQTRPRSVVRLATLARPWVRERQICSVLGRKLPQFRDLQRHIEEVVGADFDLLQCDAGGHGIAVVYAPAPSIFDVLEPKDVPGSLIEQRFDVASAVYQIGRA